MRDFKNIMQGHKYWKQANWNATDSIYTFETGSKIEFFSTDNADKLRGGRRDRGFMNEANNITFDAFEQFEVRTKEFVFLDWNPSTEYWFYTEVQPHRDDMEHITLTYLDNEALDKNIVESIEQRKNRKGWWTVYGLGQLGEVDGKIYKDWVIIDEIPKEARYLRNGLDFGYSNDPTSIVGILKYNDAYILDEVLFKKGMNNRQIAEVIISQGNALTIADSAEPKSIDEIAGYGVSIVGANKGPGSVTQGVTFVQDQKIMVTRRSANIIKEYRNYLWKTDRDGKILNEPEHTFSHCFGPNTLVNTTKGKFKIEDLVGKSGFVYSRDGKIERFTNVRETRKNTDVLKITFNDNQQLTVTPDHLLLLPTGEWVEASLLCPYDLIQSDIYDKDNNTQWFQVFEISFRKLLQRFCKWKAVVASQVCLVFRKWRYSKGFSYSSQGSQQTKQCDRKSRNCLQDKTFIRSHDPRKTKETIFMGKENTASYEEVAFLRRGSKVARITWEENMGKKAIDHSRMQPLSYNLYNQEDWRSKILSSELQNEGSQKKIIRIERGFCPITYNLDVENTHAVAVDGVIAHNSMDAIRYGIAYNLGDNQISEVVVAGGIDPFYDNLGY